MTERDRVLRALSHKQTDIVPYNLDLTDDVYNRLVKEFKDEKFYSKTGSHLAQERNESFTKLDDKHIKDMFGAIWLLDQEGDFGIVENCLLEEPNLNNYTFPEPDEKLIREKCERLEKQTDKFRMYIIGFSMYERAWSLRSVEKILMDFILEKDFVHELLTKIAEYNMKVVDIVSEYDIDCIFFGDDWGQQKGLIMGPQIWREFIKPRRKEEYDYVKSKGMYVAQHSCGDIYDVFPDLVEIGMDIYNTFQPEIYDIRKVKKEFGNDITFYGGISTQNVLPFGTADEVRAQTRELMEVMGVNGGYICAPTHSIPNDVSTENIKAFLDIVQNQKNK